MGQILLQCKNYTFFNGILGLLSSSKSSSKKVIVIKTLKDEEGSSFKCSFISKRRDYDLQLIYFIFQFI